MLTRLASSKLTAGTGNPIVATGEHAAAFGSSLLTLVSPLLIAAIFFLLIVFILVKLRKRLIKSRGA